MKKILLILLILATGYGIGHFVGVADTKRKLVYTAPAVAAAVTQDPTLLADAQALGIDPTGVSLSLAPSLTASDIGSTTEVVGTFTAPNAIQVKSGLTKHDELQTVAYEFMHYFWQNLPQAQRDQLSANYTTFYNQSSDLRTLTAPYTGSADILANERNSTACTMIPEYELSPGFNAYCDGFIKNRSILFE